MSTRTRRQSRLADIEPETAGDALETPGMMPPPGIPAQIRTEIKYERRIDPSTTNASGYPSDLAELAAEEDETLAPSDPLSVFIETWRDYEGITLRIARLPDPAARRMRGQTYARPWFGEVENLGDMPFDPANLVSTLQMINGNSGGVFRLWLADETGRPIPGAKLDRVAIADPPRPFSGYDDPRYPQHTIQQPPPPAREPSQMELRVQELQERIFNQALDNALKPAPTPPPAAADPFAGLSEEDRLTLLLVKRGDVLSQITQRVTSLAQAPDNTPDKLDWKDRGLNALVGLVETNPAVVERVSGIIERIVNRVLPEQHNAPGSYQQQPPQQNPQSYYQNPAPYAQPPAQLPPAQAMPTGLPELPEPDEQEDEQDADIMDILQELFTLFSDTRPIRLDDPVFIELRKRYQIKFRVAVGLIQKTPLPDLVAWICEQSPLYETMLMSPATSTHYIARLKELQDLVIAAAQPAQAPPPPQIQHEQHEVSPAITETPQPPTAPVPAKRQRRQPQKA